MVSSNFASCFLSPEIDYVVHNRHFYLTWTPWTKYTIIRRIPPKMQIVVCGISCSQNEIFPTFLLDTFILEFLIIIYVLIDFSSSSSSKILCTNLHAFSKGEVYMMIEKS